MPTPADAQREVSAEVRPGRVLVTGGAGFIGSHVVDALLARGDEVTVIDNLSTGRRDNLPASHPSLTFIESDLAEYLHGTGRAAWFDEVYHLAAAVGVRLVMDDPIGSIRTNVEQTAALLAYATTHGRGGRPARTLVASSSEVYGKPDRELFREDDDVVYGPTTKGRWSYACSKAIDEHLALAYAEKHALPVVIARFFNTVGPRQIGAYGMVLPNFVAAARSGADLPVHGDGGQSRCFCDVRDIAPACLRLLSEPRARGRVFNLGSDRLITILELARLVIATLGSASRPALIPYAQAYASGFEDLRSRRPDLSRVREVIGFSPSIPLERTILDLAARVEVRRVPAQEAAR